MIATHDDLEAMVRAEAGRWGWSVRIRDVDLDAVESAARGYRVLAPGAGTIEIRQGHRSTVLEYRLPEDEGDMRETLHAALRGDEIDVARRQDPYAGPAIVGGR